MKLQISKNSVLRTFLITFVLLSTGCAQMVTRQLTLTHFESGEVITGTANLVTREVIVRMPGGEILTGKFTEQDESSTESKGIAYALLKSSTSKLMLELKVSYDQYGTGFGDALTNEGKKYRVQF